MDHYSYKVNVTWTSVRASCFFISSRLRALQRSYERKTHLLTWNHSYTALFRVYTAESVGKRRYKPERERRFIQLSR